MGKRAIQIGGHQLTVNELDDIYDPQTGNPLTGSWVWSSSILLSEYILHQTRLDVRGKTVLELGAGMGIPGLTSARLGAGRVILTDVAALLPGLRENVGLNELGDRVEVRELVWGSEEWWMADVDLVLMSDVFYDESDMESLGKSVKKVSGSETEVWGATEIRSWTGACLNELVSRGFEITELASRIGSPNCLSNELDGDGNGAGNGKGDKYDITSPFYSVLSFRQHE